MFHICVICTLNRPPLLPLAIEHRRLLEAIVSPVMNMDDLKESHLLLCMDCQVKIMSVHKFQKTALDGIKNLKYLLCKMNSATPSLQPLVTMEDKDQKSVIVTIKIEPEMEIPVKNESTNVPTSSEANTEQVNLKLESKQPVELVPRCDSDSSVVRKSARTEAGLDQPTTSTWTPKAARANTRKIIIISRKSGSTAKTATAKHRTRIVRKRYKRKVRNKSKPVPCPHCDRTLSHPGSLRGHISRKHTEVEPTKCDVCGAMCRNAEVLRHHKYSHKREQTIDTLNPELFCAECAMPFSSRSAYETHRLALKHTPREQYNFECQVCQKKFPQDRRLREHVDIVHLGLRKHKCEICGKVYARGPSLRQHMTTVHEKRAKLVTYVCDLCGKVFKVKKSLMEHLLTHQGLRPYQCKLCNATFSYSAALYNHNMIKHLKKKRKKKQTDSVQED